MGDTGVFASTTEVQKYVPSWASDTYNEEVHINQFIQGWESYINVTMNYNWSDNYATADNDTKKILTLFACANVAMDICSMDISGTDIRVAEFFFDRMTDVANKCFAQLKESASLEAIKDNAA